jgi:formate/nitrite transporter FocA (FNT family)
MTRQTASRITPSHDRIDTMALLANLVPVTAGNVIGGGVLVALVYWLAYLRGGKGRS